MSRQKIRPLRLKKQEISLQRDPIENAFVIRVDDLKFYFCLYNLEDDFKGGLYFGLLQLHPEYPFAAPKLFVYTPNGRYEQNMAICTSFTNYHQESWTSAWNVRSLIQATISFMYANEPSYGCKHDSSQIRTKYARDSLSWNMRNQLFVKLFGDKIKQEVPRLKKLGIEINENQLKDMKNQHQLIEKSESKSQEPTIIQNDLLDDRIYQPLINRTGRQLDQLINQQQVEQIPIIDEEPNNERRRHGNNKRKIILGVIVGGAIVVCGFLISNFLRK